MFKNRLPSFVRYQPQIYPAWHTNGIALALCREQPGKTPLQEAWNGSGNLYFLDESGAEKPALNHAVTFVDETRAERIAVVGELMCWEVPLLRTPELRLKIRETNKLTGAVSVHKFRIKNPAL
jgi:hypothetical protein